MKKIIYVVIAILVLALALILGTKISVGVNNTSAPTDDSSITEVSTGTDYEKIKSQFTGTPIAEIDEGMLKSDVDGILGVGESKGKSQNNEDVYTYLVDEYTVFVYFTNDVVSNLSVTK